MTMLDQDVRRIEDRLKQRRVVDRDRRTGATPLTIVQVGDLRYAWVGSGTVGAGETSTVYLTLNAAAGSESIFTRAPLWQVGRNLSNTSGGIATASGPLGPSQDWSIGDRSGEFDADLIYLGQVKAYAVRITNKMTTAADYVVIASGVA